MEQPPAAGAHGVLVVAEAGQGVGDEGVELGQRLGPVEGPRQVAGLGVAEAGHAGRLDCLPQGAVVVAGARVAGLGRRAGPGLAVVVVEVPLAAHRLVALQQHLVAAAHGAVEVLHQPLLAALEELGGLAAGGVEVLAIHHPRRDLEFAGVIGELGVEAPFVGLLVLKSAGAVGDDEGVEVGG